MTSKWNCVCVWCVCVRACVAACVFVCASNYISNVYFVLFMVCYWYVWIPAQLEVWGFQSMSWCCESSGNYLALWVNPATKNNYAPMKLIWFHAITMGYLSTTVTKTIRIPSSLETSFYCAWHIDNQPLIAKCGMFWIHKMTFKSVHLTSPGI